MNLLLDTHTLIWWHTQVPALSETVRTALTETTNTVYISFVNAWEMQIKTQLGKLELTKPWKELIAEEQSNNKFQLLAANLPYVEALDNLPLYHRDPFDRLLIAQAFVEELTLVSRDRQFAPYPVPVLW